MKIYINGKLVPEREAKISVFDHGLLYGDGVFEGIRVYNGRIFELDAHIRRLYDSAKAICMTIPMTPAGMKKAVARTCKANQTANGYIRLVVTRGVGTLGLNPFLCKKPQIIIIAAKIQLYPEALYKSGLDIITVATPRNLAEAVNPRIKSLNYLNNVLAKIEAINGGCVEAVMLNGDGSVAEATGDNIFILRDGCLITPPVDAGILKGITRDVVMKLARAEGIPVQEQRLSRYDLYTADEMFLTGTAAEVVGVSKIDTRVIGSGKPGPVTRRLMALYRDYTQHNGYPIDV